MQPQTTQPARARWLGGALAALLIALLTAGMYGAQAAPPQGPARGSPLTGTPPTATTSTVTVTTTPAWPPPPHPPPPRHPEHPHRLQFSHAAKKRFTFAVNLKTSASPGTRMCSRTTK